MSEKAIVFLVFTIGSTLGSYLPVLFGSSVFSLWSVTGGAVGGILGIYIGYRAAGF